jgi:hypothetical protein
MDIMRTIIELHAPSGSGNPIAFRIMKAAYDRHIRGECRYYDATRFIITAEGEQAGIASFLDWVGKELTGVDIQILSNTEADEYTYREFDIIRSIYL